VSQDLRGTTPYEPSCESWAGGIYVFECENGEGYVQRRKGINGRSHNAFVADEILEVDVGELLGMPGGDRSQ
jgi:hypothetical protein